LAVATYGADDNFGEAAKMPNIDYRTGIEAPIAPGLDVSAINIQMPCRRQG
jgi:hypothetical protein